MKSARIHLTVTGCPEHDGAGSKRFMEAADLARSSEPGTLIRGQHIYGLWPRGAKGHRAT
jgi:hypothetical protein